jgi:hypothetical protein
LPVYPKNTASEKKSHTRCAFRQRAPSKGGGALDIAAIQLMAEILVQLFDGSSIRRVIHVAHDVSLPEDLSRL